MKAFSGKVMIAKDHTGSEHMGHPKSYSMDSNHRRSKDTPDGEVMNIRTPEVESDSGQFPFTTLNLDFYNGKRVLFSVPFLH